MRFCVIAIHTSRHTTPTLQKRGEIKQKRGEEMTSEHDGSGGGNGGGSVLTVSVVSLDGPAIKESVGAAARVRELIELVKAQRKPTRTETGRTTPPTTTPTTLKIIFRGQLLDPDAVVGSTLRDGCVVHCVVALARKPPNDDVRIDVREPTTTATTNTARTRRGLERLAILGFSREDIESFRSLFRAETGAASLGTTARQTPADLEAEEAWLAQVAARRGDGATHHHHHHLPFPPQPPGNDGTAEVAPTEEEEAEEEAQDQGQEEQEQQREASVGAMITEVAFGFVLGVLLGVIMLFWIGDGALSRRVKLGILAGVSTNILVSITARTSK
jgi:hypothetical protein